MDEPMDDPMEKPVTIPVIEERMQVGKRRVEQGGVRIVTRIEEHPFERTLDLPEERVTVERRRVDRPATEADFAVWRVGRATYRERAQMAIPVRRANVREEVVVGKTVREARETVRETVRATEVHVSERTQGGG